MLSMPVMRVVSSHELQLLNFICLTRNRMPACKLLSVPDSEDTVLLIEAMTSGAAKLHPLEKACNLTQVTQSHLLRSVWWLHMSIKALDRVPNLAAQRVYPSVVYVDTPGPVRGGVGRGR